MYEPLLPYLYLSSRLLLKKVWIDHPVAIVHSLKSRNLKAMNVGQ